MVTMVIIGIGVAATLQLLAAGTTCNIEAAELTKAINLARNVREHTLKLTYAEVQALHGKTYQTPIDSRGEPITGFNGWSQRITVHAVQADQLTRESLELNPQAVCVTVEVIYNGLPVNESRWYRFRPGWL